MNLHISQKKAAMCLLTKMNPTKAKILEIQTWAGFLLQLPPQNNNSGFYRDSKFTFILFLN